MINRIVQRSSHISGEKKPIQKRPRKRAHSVSTKPSFGQRTYIEILAVVGDPDLCNSHPQVQTNKVVLPLTATFAALPPTACPARMSKSTSKNVRWFFCFINSSPRIIGAVEKTDVCMKRKCSTARLIIALVARPGGRSSTSYFSIVLSPQWRSTEFVVCGRSRSCRKKKKSAKLNVLAKYLYLFLF